MSSPLAAQVQSQATHCRYPCCTLKEGERGKRGGLPPILHQMSGTNGICSPLLSTRPPARRSHRYKMGTFDLPEGAKTRRGKKMRGSGNIFRRCLTLPYNKGERELFIKWRVGSKNKVNTFETTSRTCMFSTTISEIKS